MAGARKQYIDLPNNNPTQGNHNINIDEIQDVQIDLNPDISADRGTSNIGEIDNAGRSDGVIILPNERKKESSLRKVSQVTQNLNYVEVAFDAAQQDVTFRIRGDCKKTPYADIDLTLKADPLPESDSSEDDDDFMALPDVDILMNKQ